MPKIIGLIPARGGSKGIPGKHLRQLGGRSVLAWTVDAAVASRALDSLWLSTDDEAIAQEGRRLGVRVPWLRPRALACDTTPMLAVVQHFVRMLALGDLDAIVLLQPTSPFRRPEWIAAAVGLLLGTGGEGAPDSVATVALVPRRYAPAWVFRIGADGSLDPNPDGVVTRRQALPKTYVRDGGIYCVRAKTVRAGSLYGTVCKPLVVPATVNLDDEADWLEACRIVAQEGRSDAVVEEAAPAGAGGAARVPADWHGGGVLA